MVFYAQSTIAFISGRERETERERERDRQTETDRQTDRDTERGSADLSNMRAPSHF